VHIPPLLLPLSQYCQPRARQNVFKNGENELTSIVRHAGYRLPTEDLKTDTKRGLPKEFFKFFWTFLASKEGTLK